MIILARLIVWAFGLTSHCLPPGWTIREIYPIEHGYGIVAWSERGGGCSVAGDSVYDAVVKACALSWNVAVTRGGVP